MPCCFMVFAFVIKCALMVVTKTIKCTLLLQVTVIQILCPFQFQSCLPGIPDGLVLGPDFPHLLRLHWPLPYPGGLLGTKDCQSGIVQWGSEIHTSPDFEWSKRVWFANSLDFKWAQPFDIRTNSSHFIKNHL